MVIKTNSTESTYVNTSISDKSNTGASSNMASQMQMIVSYFATFDGSKDAASRFQEAFRVAFHPDVIVEVSDTHLLTYDTAVECIQAACDKGLRADLVDISDNGDGTVTMVINNHIPGGPKDDVTHQIAYFRGEKVIRVHAVDADAVQFCEMVARFQQCIEPPSSVADRYADMIVCFDGSVDAYSNAEPIIDEIFDRDLIVHAKDGSQAMNFEGFKAWAATFAKERNVAKLETIEGTEDGIQVEIRNVVDGIDQGPVAQVGVVKDGKIVRWSAVSDEANQAGFDKLVTSVAAKTEGMAGNIQRLRNYLAALDGRPDAFDRFEPHIDRVLAKDIVWCNEDGSQMDYDEIVNLLRDQYIPNGCYPVLESVEDNGDGSLTIVVNNHLPGEAGDPTRQVLYYGDDDLLHKLVSDGLYNTCQRVNAL